MPSSPFNELLANASCGSDEAAWDLAARYSPHMIRVVRARLPGVMRQQFDTQDFLQQVWASLFLSDRPLIEFEDERDLLRYLSSMVRYKILGANRASMAQKRDVRRTVPIDTGAGVDQEQVAPEPHAPPQTGSQVLAAREKWENIIRGKPERVQKIVALRLAGNNNDEIAAECEVTVRTVRRVLKDLREDYLRD